MLIYAGIAAFGLLLLLILLFVGEIFGDHDVSHDGDLGGHDVSGGPSIFSIRIMAAFLTAFGAGGVIARYYDLSHVAASAIGIVCGVVMAGIVYQFAKLLYAQQASSHLQLDRLIGATGEVSVSIPEGGVGQITISAAGERTEHIARTADGQPVARGIPVTITGLGGDSVIVAPAERPKVRLS